MIMYKLDQVSVQYVKGVGPAKKKLFENLGVQTVEDLLYLFPRRYEDRRNLTPIVQVQVGQWHTISGKIISQGSRKSWYTKKRVSEILIDDGGGRICLVWFNQPYIEKYLQPDKRVVCFGKVDLYKDRLQMVSPEYELLSSDEDEHLNLSRIVPIYPLTRGMTQRYLRKTIMGCLEKYRQDLRDELPVSLRNKHRLYNIKRSIDQVHFPTTMEDQEEAMRRVSFEEFFFFQISVVLRRLSITQKRGITHTIADNQALKFIDYFPFDLTKAQKRAIREIKQDMQGNSPMLRLLQGDVGSGKTVVAFFGCVVAYENGFQSAIMAPTEILARQHYENITSIIQEGYLKEMEIALLTGNLKSKEKESIHKQIEEGKIDLVIGTHALISESLNFKKLSYVVVDEQHKFGVRQRALLTEKGTCPDVLIMTATPIPRTLCITLYGDLDLSVLDEMPPSRGKIKTHLYKSERDKEVYALVRAELEKGNQAYIVYPIIEESEKLDLKAAEEMFKHFKKEDFKGFKIGLIHGQLKKKESEEMMQQFKERKIDLLVATTVLEVGIDVPNASVMVIEHAERFGLAQLHQLRGRIGRGGHDGLCFLIAEAQTAESIKRLEAIVKTTDGFKIAEKDLQIRGPGRFFGRHQHGLNELKVANPATQLEVLELAREEALELTKDDPRLDKNPHIKSIITNRYPTYLQMVSAG